MTHFKAGDIAYHRGSWSPILVLGDAYIWNGTDSSDPGYRVYMADWFSGPQLQAATSLLTFEENEAYMLKAIAQAEKDLIRAERMVEGRKNDLERLYANRDRVPVWEGK